LQQTIAYAGASAAGTPPGYYAAAAVFPVTPTPLTVSPNNLAR